MDNPLTHMTTRQQVREWLAETKPTTDQLKQLIGELNYPTRGSKKQLMDLAINIAGAKADSQAIKDVMARM
jgi:hypothetical protein